MIKLFADTADLDEIKYCFSVGVNDGITTNPKIMELTGDLSLGFEGACKEILLAYPNCPVSLETDLRGVDVKNVHQSAEIVSHVLLEQADRIYRWAPNVVVKIPVSKGGLIATKVLREMGVKTNVTACMTPYQALEAARSGATYVSLFANRMLDGHILELSGSDLEEISRGSEWKDRVKANKGAYFDKAWQITLSQINYVARTLDGGDSQLIVGSIRSPEDIRKLVRVEPQVITIPTGIVKYLEKEILE